MDHAGQYGPSGKTILNRAKVRMIGDAVQKACGNADGVIENPSLVQLHAETVAVYGS